METMMELALPGVGSPLRLFPTTNAEWMYVLDEAWNARDWDTFDAYHDPDHVVVYWPERQSMPTRGGPDHRAEAERCRLFLLIAFGESVATPGAALAGAPIRAETLASGLLALAGTLCLWWLYFRAEPIALRYVASAEDRVYASRMGTNGLLFMIAG